MDTFVVSHDEVPKSLNAGGAGSRQHWAAAKREKEKWEGIYFTLCLAKKIPKGYDRIRVEAWLAFTVKRRRDADNYKNSISKPLADALVNGGFIPDDTQEHFELTQVVICEGKLINVRPGVTGRITLKLDCFS